MASRGSVYRILAMITISVVSVVLCAAVLDEFGERQTRAEAKLRIEHWKERFEQRIQSVDEVCRKLGEKDKVSRELFLESLLPLSRDTEFLFAEWHPRIDGQTRPSLAEFASDFRHDPTIESTNPSIYPMQFTSNTRMESEIDRYPNDVQELARTIEPRTPSFSKPLPGSNTQKVAVYQLVTQQSQTPERMGLLVAYFRDLFGKRYPSTQSFERTEVIAYRDIRDDENTTRVVRAKTAEIDFTELERIVSSKFEYNDVIYDIEIIEKPDLAVHRAKLSLLGLLVVPAIACVGLRLNWRRRAAILAGKNTQLSEAVTEHVEIQRTLQSLLKLREKERRLVANEIHDGFIQEALSAQMFLEALAHRISDGDKIAKRELQNARQLVELAVAEARRMVNELKPQAVDQHGFIPALQRLTAAQQERFGLSIALRYPLDFPELELQQQRSLYRIIQEAIANVRRHSGTLDATVSLHAADDFVSVDIADQGCGFDADETKTDSFGLRGVRERAQIMGGDAIIKTLPGEGTLLTVRLPLDSDSFISDDFEQLTHSSDRWKST